MTSIKAIKNMYRDLVVGSIILNVFDATLTALVIMAISYMIIYFYRINYLFAVVLAVLFFLRSLIKKIRQNKILVIEKEYPNLKERLRTSYDNQDTSNTVANSLHEDIMNMMNRVDMNAYLNIKKISFKVFAILILMFSTLYFSSVGFDVLELKTRIVQSSIYQKIKDMTSSVMDQPGETKEGPKLKEPEIKKLGDKDVNVTIETYNTQLDISEISEPEKNDYGGYYPDEITGAAQEIYQEDIPEEYKDVVKDYFGKIR